MSESGNLERTDREILIGVRKDIRYVKESIDKDLNLKLSDHEARIRILENFRWWFLGGIVGSGGLAGLVAGLMAKVIR